MRGDQETKSASTVDMSNSERLLDNKAETMKNITGYAESIMPDVLGGIVPSDIKETSRKKLDELLNSAADSVNNRKYSAAIDKLEEAKDLASGIIWKKYIEYKHKDGSIDLIRDATMQEHIGENKAAHDHIITLMRNIEVLRGAEELMKTSEKGTKNVEKHDFLKNIKNDRELDIDEDEQEEKLQIKKGSKLGKLKNFFQGLNNATIFKCKEELVAAIRNSTSNKIKEGYEFAEPEYILKVRGAVKNESGIKNKNAKMDWVRKNVSIEDRQYHVTTIIKQQDKDGKPVLASDSSVMMLGFSRAQIAAYKYIDSANGKVVDFRSTGIKEDKSISEIASRYNKMDGYQRKIVSNSASHISSQDKVVPTFADGFDCIKNPRCEVITLHQEFRLPDKPPQIKSSQVGESYSIDGIKDGTRSKVEQLKGFFDGQKINITLLGSPKITLGIKNFFSKSTAAYSKLKDIAKEDKDLSIDAMSLRSNRAFVSDDADDFKKTLKDTGGIIKANCEKQIEETREHLKGLNKTMRGLPKDSPERKEIARIAAALDEKIHNLSYVAKVADYIKHNRSKDDFLAANDALGKIDKDIGYQGILSVSDLSHLLNAKRLIRGVSYEGGNKEQHTDIAAIKSMVMSIAATVHKQDSSKTIDIMTSVYPGRVVLVSLRAAHQSITSALGLNSLHKEDNDIMKSNLNKQLHAEHEKHIASSRGVHGISGIDKKDVKGILDKSDPIYKSIVDIKGTGKTLENGNKLRRIGAKIAGKVVDFVNWCKDGGESILIKIARALVSLVLCLVKVLIGGIMDLYQYTKDLITGNEKQAESQTFLCSGLPASMMPEGVSNDVVQTVDPLSNSLNHLKSQSSPDLSKQDNYPMENNLFAEDKSPVQAKDDYPRENNPFDDGKDNVKVKNSSEKAKVSAEYDDKLNPFSDKAQNGKNKMSQESEKRVQPQAQSKQRPASWTSTVAPGAGSAKNSNDTRSSSVGRI